ncbi:5-oxoprolinase subunit PxpB [Desertibaculum subflavum]|uniref:5-oxoprolinase subunit PxpB n=1 Tax=Desertibaculum subflavum TaxID=2268458 RepID=UPI000E664D39
MTAPKVLAAGDAAFSIEFGDAIDPALNARVHALDRALAAAPLPGMVETVPTYRSLLVYFDPLRCDPAALREALLARTAATEGAAPAPGRLYRVPVRYGGAMGEDLEAVAAKLGLAPDELVRRHSAPEYRVYMIGFSPGLAYLGGLPAELVIPRRDDPRPAVPRGAVLMAGQQTLFYPVEMPTGFHVLGRTPVRAFDLARPEPFLLKPGDRVRFHAIGDAEYARLDAAAERGWTPEAEA